MIANRRVKTISWLSIGVAVLVFYSGQANAANPSPPTVTTEAASAIHETTATLNADVNPHDQQTIYRFDVGTTPALGSDTVPLSVGARTGAVRVNSPLIELAPGSTYYYRVIASNASGQVLGAVESFMTSTTPEIVLLGEVPSSVAINEGLGRHVEANPPFALSASSSTPSVCTIGAITPNAFPGRQGQYEIDVSFIGLGQCDLVVVGEEAPYLTVERQVSFTVTKRRHHIELRLPSLRPVYAGESIRGVSARSSGATLSSTTPLACSISGETLRFLTQGRCTIAASEQDNAEYQAAEVERSFQVLPQPRITSLPGHHPLAGTTAGRVAILEYGLFGLPVRSSLSRVTNNEGKSVRPISTVLLGDTLVLSLPAGTYHVFAGCESKTVKVEARTVLLVNVFCEYE